MLDCGPEEKHVNLNLGGTCRLNYKISIHPLLLGEREKYFQGEGGVREFKFAYFPISSVGVSLKHFLKIKISK